MTRVFMFATEQIRVIFYLSAARLLVVLFRPILSVSLCLCLANLSRK